MPVQFREVPFLRLVVPLISGVIIADTLRGVETAAWVTIISAVFLLTFLVMKSHYQSSKLFGIVLSLFLLAEGYLLFSMSMNKITSLPHDRSSYLVRLQEYPDRKSNSYSFRARILSYLTDSAEVHPCGSMLLYFTGDSLPGEWRPGDRIMLNIRPLPVVNNGNPCEFNYSRYMKGQGVGYFGIIGEKDIILHDAGCRRNLRELSLITARKMIMLFKNAGLADDDLALVTALTIGEKDLLDRDLLTSFSRTGAMHIMAVSGLHVGMISLCLSYLLFFLRNRLRVVRVLIIVILLWAFAFITGLSPSVLRATIMFSFLQAGLLMNRPGNSMNLLLASAFILIIARPAVVFEAGFQLSYIAVAFIIAFYEPLHSTLHLKNRVADFLWQMIAVSLVAQAGTMPLTVRLFNTFPLLFLVTNLVVIPVSFVIMVCAFLLIVFSAVEPLSRILVAILGFLSDLTLGFTTSASSLPHGVIENIGLSGIESILLSIAIVLLLTSLLRVRKVNLQPFLVTMIILLGCTMVKYHIEAGKEGEIIYSVRGREVRAVRAGRKIILEADVQEVPAEIKKHASTKGLTIEVKQNN